MAKREILVHNPSELKTIPYKKLKAFQGDLKKTTEDEIRKLAKSISDHGVFLPKFVWFHGEGRKRKAYILDGHQTQAALEMLHAEGYTIPEIPYIEIEAKDRKDAVVKLMQINSRYAQWNPETSFFADVGIANDYLVDLFHDISIDYDGFNLEDLGASPPVTPEPEEQPEASDLDDVVDTAIKDSSVLLVQYSGGKDSTVALIWAQKVAKEYGKRLQVIFVETGAEFQDLSIHVMRTCERIGADLTVVRPEEAIHEYYFRKKEWPDSIFRECLHRFINKPVDDYLESVLASEQVLIIRGGMGDQRTTISKSSMYQELPGDDGVIKSIVNPFYNHKKVDYLAELELCDDYMWDGYKLGFIRTACWLCPFQRIEQWNTMKEHYPILWKAMKQLSVELKFKYHRGDGNYKRFKRYWKADMSACILSDPDEDMGVPSCQCDR